MISNVAVTFPQKLHELISDDANKHIIQWVNKGTAFKVINTEAFEREIVPKYFRHTKLTSFQRQLNLYGFRRMSKGECQGAYYHPKFMESRKDLLSEVRRVSNKTQAKGGNGGLGGVQLSPNFTEYDGVESLTALSNSFTDDSFSPPPNSNISNMPRQGFIGGMGGSGYMKNDSLDYNQILAQAAGSGNNLPYGTNPMNKRIPMGTGEYNNMPVNMMSGLMNDYQQQQQYKRQKFDNMESYGPGNGQLDVNNGGYMPQYPYNNSNMGGNNPQLYYPNGPPGSYYYGGQGTASNMMQDVGNISTINSYNSGSRNPTPAIGAMPNSTPTASSGEINRSQGGITRTTSADVLSEYPYGNQGQTNNNNNKTGKAVGDINPIITIPPAPLGLFRSVSTCSSDGGSASSATGTNINPNSVFYANSTLLSINTAGTSTTSATNTTTNSAASSPVTYGSTMTNATINNAGIAGGNNANLATMKPYLNRGISINTAAELRNLLMSSATMNMTPTYGAAAGNNVSNLNMNINPLVTTNNNFDTSTSADNNSSNNNGLGTPSRYASNSPLLATNTQQQQQGAQGFYSSSSYPNNNNNNNVMKPMLGRAQSDTSASMWSQLKDIERQNDAMIENIEFPIISSGSGSAEGGMDPTTTAFVPPLSLSRQSSFNKASLLPSSAAAAGRRSNNATPTNSSSLIRLSYSHDSNAELPSKRGSLSIDSHDDEGGENNNYNSNTSSGGHANLMLLSLVAAAHNAH